MKIQLNTRITFKKHPVGSLKSGARLDLLLDALTTAQAARSPHTTAKENPMTGNRYSPYDHDPEALAWARTKIQAEINHCRKFAEQADAAHNTEQFELWRRRGDWLERTFIGNGSCVIARFDERLPQLAKAIDGALTTMRAAGVPDGAAVKVFDDYDNKAVVEAHWTEER